MNLKNYQNLLMIQTRKNRSLKKHQAMEKKTATKTGKKVKKTLQPKKAPKSPEFVDTDSADTDDEQELSVKKSNNYKGPPLLGVEEEFQSFFDLQKERKNLTIEKKVEKVVFMAGPYKGYDLSYIALCDTKYLKRMLKISGLEKKTINLIKQALVKA